MKLNKLFITTCMALSCSAMQAQEVYKIYDGVAPGSEGANYKEIVIPSMFNRPLITNVTEPTITVYRPEPEINTGACVIVAPGGGNVYLTWEEEGVNVAQWFQRHGVTGIVLKYRTKFVGNTEAEVKEGTKWLFESLSANYATIGKKPTTKPVTNPADIRKKPDPTIQGDDGRQAIRYIRAHAKELGIDPQKIAITGFSAGGSLVVNVMEHNDDACRPNLAAPIYGVFNNPGLPEHPVPTFICAPEWDLGGPEGPEFLYNEFRAEAIPAELHFIYESWHGEGLLYDGKNWENWIVLLHNFMRANKLVP
ncbi:MAG: alpha/beta hydrolase [Bacteroidales bacterium]|nr:alpha/beta hydrolase [Bacteroidales bacterium]